VDNDGSQDITGDKSDALLSAIFQAGETPVVPLKKRRWLAYVATIALVTGMAAYWLLKKEPVEPTPPPVAVQQEIMPAKQGAVLTLADGSQLVLDSMNNGVIAVQNGANILLQNGRLSYGASTDTATAFNTIATPRGRKYDILLGDGTHIWLNAASSVTYPIAFAGKERRIKITGEAYLEVAKDKERPFVVDIDGRATAQVLGTSFNVKAYREEAAMQTTLIEGSLKIGQQVLKPHEQVQLNNQGDLKLLTGIDTEPVLAWKNGIFYFKNADLATVMRELARWYDIEVVYNDAVPARHFEGEIGRDLTLSQVLKGLKGMDVHFDIRGKQILVTE
jgi:ferric-dicitrate binding protein FerR (iron transport regulator)